jgi:hypothetical protein
LFPVAYYDKVDAVRIAPAPNVMVDTVDVTDVEEAAIRSSEQAREVCNCFSLCWCIDDGEHFLEVLLDQAVVQNFILILHAGHERVLSDIVLSAAVLLVCSLDLLCERLVVWR